LKSTTINKQNSTLCIKFVSIYSHLLLMLLEI